MVEINETLSIPDDEIGFAASRSGGPGGQNVNKVNSRVTVTFDVRSSPSLTDDQREKLLERLKTRITNDGVLMVSSQQFRTQSGNREAAMRRLAELIRDALREQRPRKKTRPSRAAKERRLDLKKAMGEKKRSRAARFD